MTENRIVLDYTNRDFAGIRAQLVGLSKGLMPEWQTVGETGDFGTLLLELYAYAGDITNFYIDRMASEAFLGTAVRRQSVLYIADMLGYTPVGQLAASVPVTFTWEWTGDPETYTYTNVIEASVTDGVASLTIDYGTEFWGLGVGSTIVITNGIFTTPTSVNLEGTFIVSSMTEVEGLSQYVITFSLPAQVDASVTASLPNDPLLTVTTGAVVEIPSGTVLYSNPLSDGTTVYFENRFPIILDSLNKEEVRDGSDIWRVRSTGSALEGTTVNPREIGTSMGIPNAEFIIDSPGVVAGSISVYTVEGGQAVFWSGVNRLSLASPTQSVFTTYVDDNNYTHVVFGDGASGRIPPVNARIYVGYRYGVGAMGNTVPVNSVVNMIDSGASTAGVTVSNAASPSGGADIETTESMRKTIPQATSTQQRAVTVDDFLALALQVPGITKAIAYGSNYTSIFVRLAANSSSQGYMTPGVVAKYVVDPGETVLVLDSTNYASVGQDVYLKDFDSAALALLGYDDDALNGAAVVTATHGEGTSYSLTGSIARTSNVTTFTVTGNASFLTGQVVKFTDVSSGAGSFTDYPYLVVSTAEYNGTTTTVVAAQEGVDRASGTVTGTAPSVRATSSIHIATPSLATVTSYPLDIRVTSGVEQVASASMVYLDGTMDSYIRGFEAYIQDKKIVGSVVYGEPVVWSNIRLKASVVVRPLFNRTSVKTAVQAAVENVFAYDNVDFGKRISVGDVYRAALKVDGVDYLTIEEMYIEDINVLRDALGAVRDWQPKMTITGAPTWALGVATVTIGAHGFLVGDTVRVAASDVSGYNGDYVLTDVTATEVKYAVAVDPGGSPTAVGTVAFSYTEGDVVMECASLYRAVDTHVVTDTVFTSAAAHWESWDITQDIVTPAYNLPRLNPTLGTWVTATGGLTST